MGKWSQVTESNYKEGEDWFKPALNIYIYIYIYIYTFPPPLTKFFICLSSTQ